MLSAFPILVSLKDVRMDWVFDTAAKTPLGTPVSHIQMLGIQ